MGAKGQRGNPNGNPEALARYREENKLLADVVPTEQDLYDLTLKQVWRALRANTPVAIKQKYHLAILRLVKAPTSSEKAKALTALVDLTRGTGTDG